MASLELEARLDTLLSTAQTETADIDLFAPVQETEECPICMIPIPLDRGETAFYTCCGKSICRGCIYTHLLGEIANGATVDDQKCPFCRQPPLSETNQIKLLKRLMKNNNPQGFIQMAKSYEDGEDGLIQSNTKAFQMYICAAEIGYTEAYEKIGFYYQQGIAVEQDMSKAFAFYEVASKKGSVHAHKKLAKFHAINENVQQCIEHTKVAANAGDKDSMDMLMGIYKKQILSKEELTQTLRAHQASINGMKSEDREKAKVIQKAMGRH